jgi:hypothetical protein
MATKLEVPVIREIKIGEKDYLASMVPHPNLPPRFVLRQKRHKHEDSVEMASLLNGISKPAERTEKRIPRGRTLSAKEIRSKISEQDIPAETKLVLQSIVDDLFAVEEEDMGFGQLKYCPLCHEVSRADKFVSYKCPECHQKYPNK